MSRFLTSLFVISIFLFSCQKGEQGPPGPEGPQGATGPQGPAGTANVQYSEWFKMDASRWKDTIMANFNKATRAIKDVPALADSIIEKGVVLAYIKTDDGSGPYQLPFTWNKNPARSLGMILKPGKIIFYNYAFDDSGGHALSSNHMYRIVIIPGGVPLSPSGNNGSINYKELCEKYKIPEY